MVYIFIWGKGLNYSVTGKYCVLHCAKQNKDPWDGRAVPSYDHPGGALMSAHQKRPSEGPPPCSVWLPSGCTEWTG